ncbi:Protein-L-isoaspartate O-methyltransferase [hydrothermal vent metagenome]|uniref:Protein-L-isoaspartate O-methyltransferase n=1 Tax=hydrothermal vent metagenome TaxID=652676 RepID=A0A3B1A1M2_9ZZZZ
MDVEQARFNMIEQQIRPWEVLDDKVLSLITETSREDFVPESERKLAFADISIPLMHGQEMMQPKIEARLLQALAIKETEMVLEIGTGSGYLTALLAGLAKHVYSVDIFPEFTAEAAEKLKQSGIKNVTLKTEDAAQLQSKHQPYDAIAFTGSCPTPPSEYLNALRVGGRLFVIVGEAPVMEALLYTRTSNDSWTKESLFETVLPALLNNNVKAPQKFIL